MRFNTLYHNVKNIGTLDAHNWDAMDIQGKMIPKKCTKQSKRVGVEGGHEPI